MSTRRRCRALLEAIKAVPPRSLILHIWQRENQLKDTPDPVEVARLVAAAAPVPVYGTVDLNIGTGIVGGVVRGTHETGTRVGADGASDSRADTTAGHSGRGRAARADLRLAPAQAMGHRSVAAASRIEHPILHADCVGSLSSRTSSGPSSSSAAQLLAIAGLLVQRRQAAPRRSDGRGP